MVKRLLKKYKYPPEGQEQALETVMAQCNQWADDEDNFMPEQQAENYDMWASPLSMMAAEPLEPPEKDQKLHTNAYKAALLRALYAYKHAQIWV